MKQVRSALAAVVVATIAGCGEQPQSPTPPAISQDPLNAAIAAAAPLAFRQLSAVIGAE